MQNLKYCKFLAVMSLVFLSSVFAQETSHITGQEDQDFQFAQQLQNRGMYDLAAVQYWRYFESYPNSPRAPEAMFRAAQNYKNAGKPQQALDTFRRLLLHYPQTSLIDQALYHKAHLLSETKAHESAALDFERIRLFKPNSTLIPDAQLNAAQAFLHADQVQNALDAVYVVIESYPTHAKRHNARYMLAKIRLANHEPQLALNELERILGENLSDALSLKAQMLKADVLYELGRFGQADASLEKLLSADSPNDSLILAAKKLSESYFYAGEYEKAIEICRIGLEKGGARAIQDQLLMIQGDCHFALNEYEQAGEAYNRVQNRMVYELSFRQARIADKLDQSNKARTLYAGLIDDADSLAIQPDLLFHSLIYYADLLGRTNQSVLAVQVLRRFMDKSELIPFRDLMLFKLAEIQEQYLKDWPGARRTYSAIGELSISSPYADEAQLGIARTFEKENLAHMAIAEYERYLRVYPGGDDHEQVRTKLDYLNRFAPADPRLADKAFNQMLATSLQGSQRAEFLFKWANEQIETFHDYHRAISLIKQAIMTENTGQLAKDRLLYNLCLCHARLAEKYHHELNSARVNAHIDTLQQSLDLLKRNYSQSQWTNYAQLEAARLFIVLDIEKKEYLNTMLDLVRNLNNDEKLSWLKEELLYLWIKNAEPTSSEQYVSVLSDLVSSKNEPRKSGALYLLAQHYIHQSRPDTAQALMQRLVEQAPESAHVPKAIHALAQLAEQRGDWQAAFDYYDRLASQYAYSQLGQQASSKRCLMLLKMERFEQAQKCSQGKRLSANNRLDIFYSTDKDPEQLWLSVQVSLEQDNQKAIEQLRDYLQVVSEGQQRARALFLMAELAAELNRLDTALGHLEELIATFPNDTLTQQARIKAADFYFERAQYENAKQYYDQALPDLSGDLAKKALEHSALCAFRMDDLGQGQSLASRYEERYSDDDLGYARILFEKGDLYLRAKNFDKAKDTFEDLADDFEDTNEGGRGVLGLARMYVILNKTDDALKTLTKITTEYTQPDILAKAYVNLADFYYENRQLESVIMAARRVLDLQEYGRERAAALRLLIRSYDDVRLYDRAIASAREYVSDYPNESDTQVQRVRIGRFLYDMKEYDRAISYLSDLKRRVDAETETEIQYWIAKCYADRGDRSTAITEFLKVKYVCKPTKMPFGVTALYEAGQIYQKIGELEKAKDLFMQVLRERGPSDDIGRAANRKIQEIDQQKAAQSS